MCVYRSSFQPSPIFLSFLLLLPPSLPSQLANVLEIDLDLVKVGIRLLPSVSSSVMYRLKYCLSREEEKPKLGEYGLVFEIVKTGR